MLGKSLWSSDLDLPERPFSPLPDPDFLFWSSGHRRAITMLDYGLTSGTPITLLTGDAGTGKTMAVEHLLRTLPDSLTVGRIPTTPEGQSSVLAFALGALSGEAELGSPPAVLLSRLAEMLRTENQNGRSVLLVFDEAQALSIPALEEIRGLGHLNHGKEPVLQFLLTGQPELRSRLAHSDLRAFAQQAADAGHLVALPSGEVTGYIRHRLRAAGGTGSEFTDGAIALAARHSDGLPRLINKLCDLAMVYASATGERQVTAATLAEALSDSAAWAPRPTLLEAAE